MNAQKPKPQQDGTRVTYGDLTVEFGRANQHTASEFVQLLQNPQVVVTYKGAEL